LVVRKKTINSISNNSASLSYRGALVGSTGYLDLHLKGSALGGSNPSYIFVAYVDSSKNPVKTINDSLTTGSLNNWATRNQYIQRNIYGQLGHSGYFNIDRC